VAGGCRGAGETPPGESTAAATPPGHAAHAEPGAKSLTDATDSDATTAWCLATALTDAAVDQGSPGEPSSGS
jgi:hypothetical protein